MVTLRKGVAVGLAILGSLGLLSIFVAQIAYYRAMPREADQGTGRVHRYRAMRTEMYVSETELKIAHGSAFMATLGFVMFALGAHLARHWPVRRDAPP